MLQAVCDVCDKPGDVTTFRFGWALTNYEIDLCDEHREQLGDVMDTLVKHARHLGAKAKSVNVTPPPPPARDQASTAEVREWAKKNGITVSEKGRVPDEVFEQYLASRSAGRSS